MVQQNGSKSFNPLGGVRLYAEYITKYINGGDKETYCKLGNIWGVMEREFNTPRITAKLSNGIYKLSDS